MTHDSKLPPEVARLLHPAPPASASAPRAQEAEVLPAIEAEAKALADAYSQGHADAREQMRMQAMLFGRPMSAAAVVPVLQQGYEATLGKPVTLPESLTHSAHEGGEDRELPQVPDDIMVYVNAYGDARADDDGTSGQRLGELTRELRRWGGSIASRAQPAAASAAVREALVYCEQWFAKHSPTAPLINGQNGEHPMLSTIRAALAAAPDVPPAEVAQDVPVDALPEQFDLDKHLDAILCASGSALRHYTMAKSKSDMRDALRQAIYAAQALVRATPRVEAKPTFEQWAAKRRMSAEALDKANIWIRIAYDEAISVGTHPEETGNV